MLHLEPAYLYLLSSAIFIFSIIYIEFKKCQKRAYKNKLKERVK